MNNEYPIFMQKNRPEERFFVCTMYYVRLMYYLVLGTIFNRMTLDKIKYQMSIVNYQLSISNCKRACLVYTTFFI